MRKVISETVSTISDCNRPFPKQDACLNNSVRSRWIRQFWMRLQGNERERPKSGQMLMKCDGVNDDSIDLGGAVLSEELELNL
jgi:hypothetical protein